MDIDFTSKELQIIELMKPGSTAEEIINLVLRDWFNANSERMYNTVKTKEEKLDEIITAHAKKVVK